MRRRFLSSFGSVPRLSSAAVALAAGLSASSAHAAPSVWVIDDGEKIRPDATDTPFEHGEDDPVWKPGGPVRLTAMRNESVAMQVVVEADDAGPLSAVTVDLDALEGSGEAEGERLVNPESRRRKRNRGRVVGEPIERYVEHLTDALIPVDRAPEWAPYPMKVAARSNGVVWIDLNVPRDQHPGVYRGAILVQAESGPLASVPVELEVVDARLPDRTVAATAGYDALALESRLERGRQTFWQQLHALRIAPLHDAVKAADVEGQRDALDGSLYTSARGYLGPAAGLGDGVLAIGWGGAFGAPDERSVKTLEEIAQSASAAHAFGRGDVFLDVSVEACGSAWADGWRKLFADSEVEELRRVRLGWRCTRDPSEQGVDVPMLEAAWDEASVRAARAQGKTPWVYGGVMPRAGSFARDADAVSPRVNGWLQAIDGIPRWIVPDVAAWAHDDPDAPGDPYFDAGGGEGVLVYPGNEADVHRAHAVEIEGVVPSIRLENWRRGIEDAGYLQLAREKDAAKADAVARWLIPSAFGDAADGKPASWSSRGAAFAQARSALLAIIAGRTPVTLEPRPAPPPAPLPEASVGCSFGVGRAGGGAAVLVVVGAWLVRRRRARPATA